MTVHCMDHWALVQKANKNAELHQKTMKHIQHTGRSDASMLITTDTANLQFHMQRWSVWKFTSSQYTEQVHLMTVTYGPCEKCSQFKHLNITFVLLSIGSWINMHKALAISQTVFLQNSLVECCWRKLSDDSIHKHFHKVDWLIELRFYIPFNTK